MDFRMIKAIFESFVLPPTEELGQALTDSITHAMATET
jgi:hypothetical protein